ncbi:MAG: S1 family peptidase [Puniceicoccales bacterium]
MIRFLTAILLIAIIPVISLQAQAAAGEQADANAAAPVSSRTLFDEPRDGAPLLYSARKTYDSCATYIAQGAVRIVKYEEVEGGGGFLFQTERGPARTKLTKLFTTAFTRQPFALRHEITTLGLGRSFTSVEFWGPQRRVADHYSSSALPMTSSTLAEAIATNDVFLVDFDPAVDWLLASNDALGPILPKGDSWLDGKPGPPPEAWWVGEETIASVDTDIVAWRGPNDIRIAVWLTRAPVAVVKLIAERHVGTDYASVTTLVQPAFGKPVGQDQLAIDRPRPVFFDTTPDSIAFGDSELPPIPTGTPGRTSAAGVNLDDTPRTTETPKPETAVTKPETTQPKVGAGPSDFVPALPGAQAVKKADEAGASLLTPAQMNAIVVIEGDKGVGTGFYCNIRGRDFIVTNQHVISGHRRLTIRNNDGKPVEAGDIYGAIGHDIALISVPKSKGVLAAASNVGADTEIGDRVVVPGNKLGGGVVTQVAGNVLGVGPDRVEVDAKFVPGNSGSPIINLDTGEVIGVATYVRKDMPENFAEEAALKEDKEEDGSIVRWFGYRIDSVEQWERIDWSAWQRQFDTVTTFHDDSMAIYKYLANDPKFYNNTKLRHLYDDFVEKMSTSDRPSSYYERETKLFIQRIINFARLELNDVSRMQFYDYFRSTAGPEHNITENIEYRQMLINHLEGLGERWRVLADRVRR